MKKRIFASLFVIILGFTHNANAAPGDVAMGFKAGTLGAGLELTFEAMKNVNMRVGVNYFKLNAEVEVEANDYDLDLTLNSITALADWFVADGDFRITAGALINKNGLKGTALPSNSYEINDVIYTSEQVGVLSADIGFKTFAPYFGIGWGNPLADDSDWTLNADLGVVLAGKPDIEITSTGGLLSNEATLIENIRRAEQDFRDTDEIKYLRIYPVISFGLNYRF